MSCLVTEAAVAAVYTLALHDALPISPARPPRPSTLELLVEIGEPSAALRLLLQSRPRGLRRWLDEPDPWRVYVAARAHETLHRRSEEHTSELQSRENLVCRLLLEKKK